MLTLEHLEWHSPDGRDILHDVNLEIPSGKLVVVTGPNGGGKTTLAKVIAGIVKPESGRIVLDGQDITSLDVTERARLGISYAFQQPVRFKGITVRQLLETAAGKEMNDAALCETLSKVGLCARDYLDREVNATLSGGEIKRIEIATVLLRHSKLSVFDEPEAGIDLWSFKSLISVFNKIHDSFTETSGSLVIISHQERILNIADEIVLLAEGRIQSVGEGSKMMEQVFQSGMVHSSCSVIGGADNE